MKLIPLCLCVLACLYTGGCEYIHVRTPSGIEGTGFGLFTKPKLTAKLADGSELTYDRDVATEAIQAAVGAAVKGAVQGAVK